MKLILMECKKRDRHSNFTLEETERLIALVESKKNIIENKKSDGDTWKNKAEAWQSIEIEFNSNRSHPFRNSKCLKTKYDGLKKHVRKKVNIIHAGKNKIEGEISTVPTLSSAEKKLLRMILVSAEGINTQFDSDPLAESSDITESFQNQESSDTFAAQSTFNINENISDIENEDKWVRWSPSSLKNQHHVLKKTKKRPFEKLAEAKLELVELQKQLVHKDIQERIMKKNILIQEQQQKLELFELEKQQKKEIFNLEKRHLQLKMQLLKNQLEDILDR